MKDKQAMSFRLSDKARFFLQAMSDEDGVGMTGLLENLLRKEAQERNIEYNVEIKDNEKLK